MEHTGHEGTLWSDRSSPQHPLDRLLRGRDQREPVAPPPLEELIVHHPQAFEQIATRELEDSLVRPREGIRLTPSPSTAGRGCVSPATISSIIRSTASRACSAVMVVNTSGVTARAGF